MTTGQNTGTRLYSAITPAKELWKHARDLRDQAYTAYRDSGYTPQAGQHYANAEELVTLTAAALQNLEAAQKLIAEDEPGHGTDLCGEAALRSGVRCTLAAGHDGGHAAQVNGGAIAWGYAPATALRDETSRP